MYLHLGADVLVRYSDIVAILDIDNTTISNTTRDFLARAQKNGEIFNVSDDLPKTFVLCQKDGKQRVYITQISPKTLYGRTLRSMEEDR